MANCTNHVGRTAAARCAGCSEPFCEDCLVEIRGEHYCGECKVMAVEGKRAPVPREGRQVPCKEADEALKYAIIGIFCLGIILGPIAISKASRAKQLIRENPRLSGEGKATAATIIGILVIVLWAIGIIVRLSQGSGAARY